jgi:hypothetical protein
VNPHGQISQLSPRGLFCEIPEPLFRKDSTVPSESVFQVKRENFPALYL